MKKWLVNISGSRLTLVVDNNLYDVIYKIISAYGKSKDDAKNFLNLLFNDYDFEPLGVLHKGENIKSYNSEEYEFINFFFNNKILFYHKNNKHLYFNLDSRILFISILDNDFTQIVMPITSTRLLKSIIEKYFFEYPASSIKKVVSFKPKAPKDVGNNVNNTGNTIIKNQGQLIVSKGNEKKEELREEYVKAVNDFLNNFRQEAVSTI